MSEAALIRALRLVLADKTGAMILRLFAFLSRPGRYRTTRRTGRPAKNLAQRMDLQARLGKALQEDIRIMIWRIWKMQQGAACKTGCWRLPVLAVMKQL